MSQKRRDNRNRILRNGESQRKDGRYRYKYVDLSGKECNLYSWRLDASDPTPAGKRKCLPLREMEKQVQRDLEDKIIPRGGELTVCELCEKYVSLKVGLRKTTEKNHRCFISLLKKDPFGKKRIDMVKQSDAKAWVIKLQRENKRKYSSIYAIYGFLKSSFELAKNDDLLRKNPFDFKLSSVVVNDTQERTGITEEQRDIFLKFIKGDRIYSKYYDMIYILFNTGLRISEFCGLTRANLDFERMCITVDHQLLMMDGEYMIEKPKTKKGNRLIPMTEDVALCFKNILRKRKTPKIEPMIDGHAGFLVLDKNGNPTYAGLWSRRMSAMVSKYNRIHVDQLPPITPHICRHTFCSCLVKMGMNPKVLQYIMGHSTISVTLDVYTHFRFNDIREEMRKIAT